MTVDHLNQAIQECKSSQLTFNRGTVRSFLFENNWYPLRAVINRALSFANEPSDLTTEQCVVKMAYLEIWMKTSKVFFDNSSPVTINQSESNKEIRSLAQEIIAMTN